MTITNQLKRLMQNPKLVLIKLDNMRIIKLKDEKYLKILFKDKLGYNLNLENPKTFSEKIQWLKLYDRNPLYTTLVDKYEVKKYVSDIIGEEYVIPTLGIYDSFDEIDFNKLPNQFVIKCTHDSGGIVICKDKRKIDYDQAKKKINKCLRKNWYRAGREWPYKNVKPRILIEKYMVDESNKELKDYKFFCFNGTPKMLFIAVDRPYATKFNYYDINMKKLELKQHYPNFENKMDKPKNYKKMIEIARKLSQNFSHIRVDLYNINGKIYFGELTFYHFSGFEPFEPSSWDKKLGDMIDLEMVKK